MSFPSSSSSTINSSLKMELEKGVSTILQSNFLVDSQKVCLLTLLKIITTILNQPNNEKVRTLKLSNKAIQSKVIQPQGMSVLLVVGFLQVILPPTNNDNNNDNEKALVLPIHAPLEPLHQARHYLQQLLMKQFQYSMDALPKYDPITTTTDNNAAAATAAATNSNFNIYQGQRYDGKSAAVGTNLGPPSNWKSSTYQQLEQLQQRQAKLEQTLQKSQQQKKTSTTSSSSPIPREWIAITKSTSSANVAAAAATSASSSSTSKEDSQLLAQQVKLQLEKQKQATQNVGFTTKAMRDLERLKKQKVYSHCQLAIEFPLSNNNSSHNGIIVKGNFLPKETIGNVQQALQRDVFEIIGNDNDNNNNNNGFLFDLYMTPPRTLLKPQQTLQELGFVPAAKIYISWKQPNVTLNVRSELLLLSNTAAAAATNNTNSIGPTAPISKPLVDDNTNKDNTSATDDKDGDGAAKKKKKTKADKESLLLKRMMGK